MNDYEIQRLFVSEFKNRIKSIEPCKNEIRLSPETILSICNVISAPFRVSCFSQLLWCVSFQFISPLQHLPSNEAPASNTYTFGLF